ADEFTATLDRPLAKVVAFNLRKLVTRTGVGVLAATTHDDIADDLNPDVWVRCRGDGDVTVERREVKKRRVVRGRAMAVGRLPIRLAVLRAVALPHAPPRLHPQGDAAVAQG